MAGPAVTDERPPGGWALRWQKRGREEGREEGGTAERALTVRYLRHLATLRPDDAHGLRVAASDIEALFHHDPELNPR